MRIPGGIPTAGMGGGALGPASANANGPMGPSASPMVEGIMRMEALPLENLKQRREHLAEQKNEYSSLSGMLGELGKVANNLKNVTSFNNLKVESSNPDILDGEISGIASPGQYEFEIKGLANADKHLARGFSSLQDSVGFGFMQIERDDGQAFDLTIDPGSTLADVRDRINNADAGVKAQIVDTGIGDDPLRLLVSSATTGSAAKINLDPDTTFLDFDQLKAAKNLEAMFEDVPISRADNKFGDLVEGLKLQAKRAEPGTKVQLNVTHDVDKTTASIKEFTDTYNKLSSYVSSQNQLGADNRAIGKLAGDGNLRSIMQALQSQIGRASGSGSASMTTLMDAGITTNPKTGELSLDENKLKQALAKDYEGVANLFVQSPNGKGVAARLADAVKSLQDPVSGVVSSRTKSLDTMLRTQDQQIERQTDRLAEKRAQVERRFAALDSKVATMQGQGQFLNARFAGAPPASGGEA